VQDLIRDILNGNQDGFRMIVQRFSNDLLRIAYHFVHDWDEAQDLTQTTWIRCYQNLRRYDVHRPFRPWLYRIHLNVCKAAAARKQKHRSREIRLSESGLDVSAEISVDDTTLILQQIERLSMRQKAAFILVEIEGMDSREAAYVMGCAESTLRVHLARAKQNLREKLMKLGIGYGSIY
jgi:RNA polymerase sigma-70 factor (ECF subfamily)